MAAYAAVVSLRHIIEQLQRHPRPPISVDNEQVQSLTEKLTFLQEFLEGCSHGGGEDLDALERRIADVAYAAEDIIESRIVDQIHRRLASTSGQNLISLYQGLHRVIQDLNLIERDVADIKAKMEIQEDQLHTISEPAGPVRSLSMGNNNNTIMGFDDVLLIEVMDKLTGQQSNRQIIPIVGMGGIGKTTLAKNVYINPLINQRFDILGWATISQDFSAREICLEVLCDGNRERKGNLSDMNEYELGDKLHKRLSGRRYLIIMDDMWSIEAWDKVKFFFPDNNNGSRIMVTTRLSDVASQLSCSTDLIEMNFLDEDKSWNLLCRAVFGEEDCPIELEQTGKKIAKNCRGLPLSIDVVGGFLAKSQLARQQWEYIAQNLNSIVNLEDDERCLKILNLSYDQLPVHLKPCFLYMGVFREDSRIRVSSIVKLWVAEGFLKPVHGKSLETVAVDYLMDLISRNLLLVDKLGSTGKTKTCRIHDLLRDLCLRKAQKGRFLKVTKLDNISHDMISTERRICIPPSITDGNLFTTMFSFPLLSNWRITSLARSVIGKIDRFLPLSRFKLLRVWNAHDTNYKSNSKGIRNNTHTQHDIFQLVNLRYLSIRIFWYKVATFPYSVHLWNLETLIVNLIIQPPQSFGTPYRFAATPLFDIWKMPQLKHVKFDQLDLPDPLICDLMDGGVDFVVMENLKTLSTVRNFKCVEEVIKRIPNIEKLGLTYGGLEDWSIYCLNNLGRLNKLESLAIFFSKKRHNQSYLEIDFVFPRSLKKLTLNGTYLRWEDITVKIGSLPHLQVLKLKMSSFVGPEWKTVEGQFCSLEFLSIESCFDLEYWRTESTHFPRLENLVLRFLLKLTEIPSGIGDVPTLKSIELVHCSESVVFSAKEIVEEQEGLGNVGLQVQVEPLRAAKGY